MIIHLHSSIENKFSQISYLLVKKLFFIADFSLISKYCGIDGVDGSHATCETYSPSFGLLEREAILFVLCGTISKSKSYPVSAKLAHHPVKYSIIEFSGSVLLNSGVITGTRNR